MSFGRYPTPCQRLPGLSRPGCDLFIKRDDLTHPLYGGNKVRKLEKILEEARARKAQRLLTVGAVGSHHVLATAVHGRAAGFEVEAVLVPQPRTAHVEQNLRADLGQGLVALAVPRLFPGSALVSYALAFGVLSARRLRQGTFYIPVGGSSVTGALGYVDAALELAAQIRAGEIPEPDLVVVTVGSGGTAAGLAAGLVKAGLACRVVAVVVGAPVFAVEIGARFLARRAARRVGVDPREASQRLVFDARYLGAGYGAPTEAGARAMERAAGEGLTLDPTYTAKTFAAVLDLVEAKSAARILYWHTLSSAPMAPLLEAAPTAASFSPALARLLR